MDWLLKAQEEWLTTEAIATITGLSILMALASLIITPALLVNLPANYFRQEKPHLLVLLKKTRGWKLGLIIAKNIIGTVLLVAGILMLVLPGQGLLTILVAGVLIDFPRKKPLLRRMVGAPKVIRSINWLRRKYKKPPLVL